MRNDKICIFAALLSLTFIACGEEISHTELVTDLSNNHIVHTLGGQRPAFLVLPADHDPETPIPLVLSLHGFTSHLAEHDRYFGLSQRVNDDRFALIMANGTHDPDGKRFWNATDFCCDLHNTQVDDVKYLSGLLEEAATHIAVERIFALGHSNGGFMSYRLACEGIPGLVAIASLAGTSFSDPSRCAFASPVSVLQIHGTADKVVAYDGSTGEHEYAGAEEVALRWAALARCDLTDPETLPPLDLDQGIDGPETIRTRYRTGCRHDVTIELWTIGQGAHVPDFAPDFGQRLLEWLFNDTRIDYPILDGDHSVSLFLQRLNDPHPLLYDGGFGSELFARQIELTNSTLANESYPEAVVDIHAEYIAAGADCIGTNTFVASELHLAMADKDPTQAGALARRGAELAQRARERSERDVFIAGSIGPSPGAIEADAGSTDFGIANDKVRAAHQRIIDALCEGGVDFFSVETQFSAVEAAMVCDIARQTGLPIAVNLALKYTQDRKSKQVVYRTDWGHSVADLLDILASGQYSNGDNLLDHVHLVGVNCCAETRRSEHTGMPYALHGAEQFKAAMQERGLDKKLMTYPNAGMPQLNSALRTIYSQSPEEMAAYVPDLATAGVQIIGGCCGTTPDHIRAFRRALDP